MVLLAAFKAVLARYTNQTDITVGTPIAGRDRTELADVVGYFVNSVTLRSNLDPAAPLSALIDTVRETVIDGLGHQTAPFDAVVSALNLPRDVSRNPIYQISFALNNQPRPVLRMAGLQGHRHPVATETAKFDLSLTFEEHEHGLAGTIEYSTDLFDASTIARLASHFQRWLQSALADPTRAIGRLAMLDDTETRQVLQAFNDTAVEFDLARCLPQLIEDQVARTPKATALVCGTRSLTYDALNRRANQLAHHLRALGVVPEQRVGVCLARGIDLVVAMLAVWKAGGAYVPLDPDAPAERLRFQVADASIRTLLTRESAERFGSDLDCVDPQEASLAARPDTNPVPAAAAEHLCYVIYTSGSTGQPKGVLIEHGGLVNNVCWQIREFGFTADDRFLQWTAATFDASMWEIWTPLVVGAVQIIADEDTRLDPALTLQLIRSQRVSFASTVPGFFSAMLTEIERSSGAESLPLRLICVGGEALDPVDARRWAARCDVELVNNYGPTETTIDATFERHVERLVADPAVTTIPIGRPMANTRAYIVDRFLQPVPVGIAGELYFAGAGIARGYLNRPELTAERFIADPFAAVPGARLYRTGDLGRFRVDGRIEFLGRTDHQIKLRGYRIELDEIESALRSCDGVTHATVILDRAPAEGPAYPDRLVGYVAPGALHPARLREQLALSLPSYMVPAIVVALGALPTLSNGKIDRKALPRPDASTHAALRSSGSEAGATNQPEGPIETQLERIWAETLGLPSVDPTASFFDLGGHSLLALKVMHRIEQQFGRQLRLAMLFSAPSVRQLARLIGEPGQAQDQRSSCVVAIRSTGARAPLFFVSGWGGAILGFNKLAGALDAEQPLYVLDTGAFDVRRTPVTSVEQVAGFMVHDLRQVQPEGPYYLGGFSQGGKFVYEVARQLVAAGQQVALLALMDVNAPGYPMRGRCPGASWPTSRRMTELSLRGSVSYVTTRVVFFYKQYTGQNNALFADDGSIAQSAVAQAMQQTADAITAAWKQYTPQSYPGRLLLITASIRQLRASVIDDDPELGWRGLIGGRIDVRRLECEHPRMMDPAHASALAGILSEFLQRRTADRCEGGSVAARAPGVHPLQRSGMASRPKRQANRGRRSNGRTPCRSSSVMRD